MNDKVYLIVDGVTVNDAHGSNSISHILGATLTIKEANDYIMKQKISADDQGDYEVISDNKHWGSFKGCEPMVYWDYTLEYKDQTRVYHTLSWIEVSRLDKEP